MNKYLLLVVVLLCSTRSTSLAQNLVKNGGAEQFEATTKAPTDWTIVSGEWHSDVAGPSTVDAAYEGTYIFDPGSISEAILQQDIDLSSDAFFIDRGRRRCLFAGFVQSFDQGPTTSDVARIIVECMNNDKSKVLHKFDSDSVVSISEWKPVTTAFTPPQDTRHIRITLMAKRKAGFANDGYFDAISLLMHPLGIDDADEAQQVKVYPTIADKQLTIENAANSSIIITDNQGKIVHRMIADENKEVISISTFPYGIYVIRIQNLISGEEIRARMIRK